MRNLIGSKLDPILSPVLGPVSGPFLRHFRDPKRLGVRTSVTGKLGNSKIGWEAKSGPVSGPLFGSVLDQKVWSNSATVKHSGTKKAFQINSSGEFVPLDYFFFDKK